MSAGTLSSISRGLAHWQNPNAGISSHPIRGEPFDTCSYHPPLQHTGTNLLSLKDGYLPPALTNAWIVAAVAVGAACPRLALSSSSMP